MAPSCGSPWSANHQSCSIKLPAIDGGDVPTVGFQLVARRRRRNSLSVRHHVVCSGPNVGRTTVDHPHVGDRGVLVVGGIQRRRVLQPITGRGAWNHAVARKVASDLLRSDHLGAGAGDFLWQAHCARSRVRRSGGVLTLWRGVRHFLSADACHGPACAACQYHGSRSARRPELE